MNKAMLPIMARLRSLQTSSSIAQAGVRIVAPTSDPAPHTAILREINETVLGRILGFSTGNGTNLKIEVAGRRILRVVSAEGLSQAEACLADPVLEDEHKDGLIKLIQELARPGQEIRVVAEPSTQGSESVSVGLPVALIADLMLVELNSLDAEVIPDAPSPSPPEVPAPAPTISSEGSIIGRFARSNGAVLMAWLISGGAEDGTTDGPEEMVDHLRGFLEDEIGDLGAQLDRFTKKPGDPACLALGASLTTGHSILCARADGSILLGLAEGDLTQGLLVAWTSALS